MRWPWTREIKESATGALIYMQTMGRAIWTPRNYEKLSKEAYEQNAISYRCVRLIAEAVSNIPWLICEGDKELDEHPLFELLRRPNSVEGGEEFVERLVSFYLLSGNLYMEAVILDKEIRELFALRPDRMTIELDRKGYPAAYIYKVGNNKTKYQIDMSRGTQQTIMHMKSFHPTNDQYGLSAIEPGAFAIDSHNAAGQYNKSLLDNQAKPSGALVYSGGKDSSGNLSNEQFTRLKKELDDNYTGAKNAGRPLLLEGGLDWKEMGLSPQDMEFTEGKREAAREIALSNGVPPMLLGIPGDNTYSNYAEANKAFYRQTVLPLVGKICGTMTNFLAPTYGNSFKLWYNIDEIQALAVEREAVWDKVKDSTFLTIDEKREATGYAPYEPPKDIEKEPGAILLIPATVVPLEDMGMTMGGEAETEKRDGENDRQNETDE